MAISESEAEKTAFMLSTVFQPAAPVSSLQLFAGRSSQARDVVDAINQQGQHAILFGDRGVGKTSLANTISARLTWTGGNKLVPIVNCLANDSFHSVWGRVFEQIRDAGIGDERLDFPPAALDLLEASAGPHGVAPDIDTVLRVLAAVGSTVLLVVVLDEFECLEDDGSRRTMAGLVKYMSDKRTPATLVFVGVGDDVTDLFDNHESVERCIAQIRMPRMTYGEIAELVQRGYGRLQMTVADDALRGIWGLCRGLPHYAHLLALHAGRRALDRRATAVESSDLDMAIQDAIHKSQQSIRDAYANAITSSRKDALYKQVLTASALALAQSDDLGFFYPGDVRPHLEGILKRTYKVESFARHLDSFCQDSRGAILVKDLRSARPRYRFAKPMFPPYIVIRGIADGLIRKEDFADPAGRLSKP